MRATVSTVKRHDAAHDAMMRAVMPAASAATPKDSFDYVRSLPWHRDVLATAAVGARLVKPVTFGGSVGHA